VTLVRLKLVLGECQGLPRLLEALIHRAEQQGRYSFVIEALLLEASALDCLGETAEAKMVLDRALSLAEPAGYVRIFVDAGTLAGKLL
jgi:LuxR family maltose regulon positive regulatory protein